MNKEIKEKWLAKLESGDYAKGKGRLRDKRDDTFCCLGVLCDLYIEETGKGEWITDDGNKISVPFSTDFDTADVTYLPNEVAEWADINFRGSLSDADLAAINDTNETFKPVIAEIREHF